MPSLEQEHGTGRTIGAASVDLATFALPDNASAHIEADVSGRTAAGITASARLFAGTERSLANSRLVGAVVIPLTVQDAALIGWLPQLVVSSTRIVLRVTGVAGQTVTWFGHMRLQVNNG